MSQEDVEKSLDADDIYDPSAVRRRWPLVVLALVALGVAGTAFWYFVLRTPTRPNVVVVAIRADPGPDAKGGGYWWDGDPSAQAIATALAVQLDGLGFDVLDTSKAREALEGASSAEAIRDAASRLEAGLVITGVARVAHSVPLDGEIADYSVELELGFLEVESGRETAAPGMPLAFFEWGRSPEEALGAAAERMAASGAAPLANALAADPTFERLKAEGDSLSYDEAKIANQLEGLFRIAGHYANQMKQRADDEKQEALEQQALESSGLQPHQLGDFLAEEHYVGSLPNGDVLLMVEPHFVDVQPDKGEYTLRRESERLVLADRDGKNRRMVFEHFNFFSATDLATNGSKAVAVIDNRGVSKWLVALSLPEGQVRVLAAHAQDYYSSPAVSPDGSRVAFWARPGRRAPSTLEVVDTAGGHRRQLVGSELAMSYPRWSSDSKTLYLSVGVDRRDSVVAIDLESGDQTFLLGPSARPGGPRELAPVGDEGFGDEGVAAAAAPAPTEPWDPRWDSAFDSPVPSPDGKWLFAEERDSSGDYEVRHLGRLELATGAYQRMAEMRGDVLLVSPDSRFLAVCTRSFVHPDDPGSGDDEVVLLPVEGGEPKPVTLNAVDDFLGGWSADGRSVFVSQSSRDPGGRRFTARVYRYDLD